LAAVGGVDADGGAEADDSPGPLPASALIMRPNRDIVRAGSHGGGAGGRVPGASAEMRFGPYRFPTTTVRK
jgi:hypothetical protein